MSAITERAVTDLKHRAEADSNRNRAPRRSVYELIALLLTVEETLVELLF